MEKNRDLELIVDTMFLNGCGILTFDLHVVDWLREYNSGKFHIWKRCKLIPSAVELAPFAFDFHVGSNDSERKVSIDIVQEGICQCLVRDSDIDRMVGTNGILLWIFVRPGVRCLGHQDCERRVKTVLGRGMSGCEEQQQGSGRDCKGGEWSH